MTENNDSICDRCAAETDVNEMNMVTSPGEWQHCAVCNECAAELAQKNTTGTDQVITPKPYKCGECKERIFGKDTFFDTRNDYHVCRSCVAKRRG